MCLKPEAETCVKPEISFNQLISLSLYLCCLLGKDINTALQPPRTDRVNVEGVGADEGDPVLQIVVLDSVLVVLVGHHSQSQGPH